MSGCLLKKLQSPLIRAALPGLIVHPQGIQLVQKHLTCCAGKGVSYNPVTDQMSFCSLTKRMALVAALAKQTCMRGGKEPDLLARSAGTQITPEVTHRFAEISGKKSFRGLAIAAGETSKNIQVAYALALAAVWRFEIRAVVVELGHNASIDNFVLSLRPENERLPELVITAGIGRLWETQRLEHLEIVIGAAHRGGLPMFACLEPFEISASVQEQPRSFRRSVIKNRIAALRNKHPFSFLAPGVLKQLAAICQGTELPPGKRLASQKTSYKPLSPEA